MGLPKNLPLILSSTLLLLLSLLPTTTSKTPEYFNETFGPFYTDDYNTFTMINEASISGGALQITPDTINSNFNLANRSGRVMYSKSFLLWKGDKNSTSPQTLASFSTSFLVNIFRPNNFTSGEGLAFLIAPNLTMPSSSQGQWLGLTNLTTDGNPLNQFIAIELDTFQESFDPNNNHIGLNINSVKSNITYNLSSIDIELAPIDPKNYTIWVDYNGSSTLLNVYIALEGKPKPISPVIQKNINLKEIIAPESYFGFSASTGNTSELNCVLMWNLTVETLPMDKDPSRVVLLLAIGIPILTLVIVGCLVGYYLYKKRIEGDASILGTLKSLPGTPREFLFKDLKRATNNFDERNKLGQGGFGVVYKGFLAKENIEVAVKKFSRENIKGRDDFLAELIIINRLRHRHLVRLVGWCHKNGMLLLVYDYMPNGSLDKYLFGEPESEKSLSWVRRYNIISGVASALHYLHDEYDQKVVHRDLKASNIMLDSDYNARLGDFGLARALDNEKTSYAELEGVAGTMGYIAPECFHTGKATCESDVYGFGAVVLEVVCGQHPRVNIEGFHFLVDWVWRLYREGRILEAVDERLKEDYVAEDVERLLKLGMACSHPTPSERPKTQAIVQIISRSVPPPWVPPIKPSFVWPTMGPVGDDDSSVATGDTMQITSSYYGSGWTPRDNSEERNLF
ncbi:putative L-type lectin-domain containing receptor kinase S.5 [Tasmannia lanceolata]|uniref:putative L-type lectin-domain containing receptor kinase S.5 n=1 Tax=Tasmannia lanceolata TaxID=3420 RepID=UPI004062D67F